MADSSDIFGDNKGSLHTHRSESGIRGLTPGSLTSHQTVAGSRTCEPEGPIWKFTAHGPGGLFRLLTSVLIFEQTAESLRASESPEHRHWLGSSQMKSQTESWHINTKPCGLLLPVLTAHAWGSRQKRRPQPGFQKDPQPREDLARLLLPLIFTCPQSCLNDPD